MNSRRTLRAVLSVGVAAVVIAMSHPLIAGQDDDVKKRIAALEAGQQVIFRELQELQQALVEPDFVKSAQALGLNAPAFQQCLAGRTTARSVTIKRTVAARG